jgi:hypothetical protein
MLIKLLVSLALLPMTQQIPDCSSDENKQHHANLKKKNTDSSTDILMRHDLERVTMIQNWKGQWAPVTNRTRKMCEAGIYYR